MLRQQELLLISTLAKPLGAAIVFFRDSYMAKIDLLVSPQIVLYYDQS
jgi:hypothetical protein